MHTEIDDVTPTAMIVTERIYKVSFGKKISLQNNSHVITVLECVHTSNYLWVPNFNFIAVRMNIVNEFLCDISAAV